MRTLKISAGMVLGSALLASCSYNPVNQRPQVILTSKAKEQSLGEQEAEKVKATMGLVEERTLTEYIDAIGRRLVAQTSDEGFDFHFHVVNMKQPNAFALPGGNIYVSRGILALANSEDEVAGVVGHEIAHVVGRHTGGRITAGAPLKIITGIPAAVTGIISPAVGNLIGGIGGLTEGLLLSPYDRNQERAADRFGLELAAKAGWDPGALAEILHALEREEDLEGNASRGFDFFASHPKTPERVANTSKHAKNLEKAPGESIAPTREQFLAKIEGLVLGDDPAAGIFEEELFIQPDMGIALQFPKGWKTYNGPTQVIGAAPDEDAIAVLEIAGEGDDPSEVARAAAKARGIDPDRLTHDVNINGLTAVRTKKLTGRSGRRDVTIEATWVAHGGNVYQIICATTPDKADSFHEDFLKTAHSFRAATTADRALVKVTKLRTTKARAGETVTRIVERTGSKWDADMAAIANGVQVDTALEAGTLVKLAIEEPYRSK